MEPGAEHGQWLRNGDMTTSSAGKCPMATLDQSRVSLTVFLRQPGACPCSKILINRLLGMAFGNTVPHRYRSQMRHGPQVPVRHAAVLPLLPCACHRACSYYTGIVALWTQRRGLGAVRLYQCTGPHRVTCATRTRQGGPAGLPLQLQLRARPRPHGEVLLKVLAF